MKKLLLILFGLSTFWLSAQVSEYSFTQTQGTYTPLTGGAILGEYTGTAGVASLDNVIFNLPTGTIPFPFFFDGNTYTGINISGNGFITFGETPPLATTYTPLSVTTAYNGAIGAFTRDLQGGWVTTGNRTSGSPDLLNVADIGLAQVGDLISGTGIPVNTTIVAISGNTITMNNNATTTGTNGPIQIGGSWANIQYEVLGSAPNRVFVVEYNNMKRWGTTLTSTQHFRLNFQIRLNEVDNSIEVVYGDCSPGLTTLTTVNQAGLRGPNNTFPTNVNARMNLKGTNDNWLESSPATANSSGLVFNNVTPANEIPLGLTYRWAPPTCIAPSNLSITGLTSTSVTVNWIASVSNPADGYEWELRTEGNPGSGPTGLVASGDLSAVDISVLLSGLTAETSYTFYIRSNCGSDDFSNWVAFGIYTGYCLASSTNQNSWISVFNSTGAVTNMNYSASSGNAGGYANLSSIHSIANFIDNGPTSISLTAGGPTCGFAIWIDWNDDMIFDASEKMFNTTAYTTTTNGTLTIPPGTPVGNYRMRVVVDFNQSNPASPCGNITRGEFVDYNFEVLAPPACVFPTDLNTTDVMAQTATLNWTASTSNPVNGYEWEVRTEGAPGSGPTGLVDNGDVAAGIVTTNAINLSPLTDYTFYVRANCGGNGFSDWVSDVFTTSCLPPDVLTTTPNTRCGEGTTELSATVSAGTAAWYDAATGGNQLGQGLTFTTPVISETTSYYVEAREADNFTGGAKLAPTTTTSTSGAGWGLVFDLTSSITLNSVDVYLASANAGNVVVELRDNTGALLQTTTVAVPAGNSSSPIQHTLPIGFDIQPGNGYRLVSGAGNVNLVRESSGNIYPYPIGTAGNITSGYISGTSTAYYWFYNWNFDVICASPRIEVVATVTAPPALTLSSTEESICEETTSDLVTLTSIVGDYDTYYWNPTSAVSGTVSDGFTFNPSESTTFTLTAEQASGSLCSNSTTISVIVNPNPSALSISPVPSVICLDEAVTLSTQGGNLPNNGQIGLGIATNTLSTPFKGWWGGTRTQALYTAAELSNLGLVAGDEISSLGYVALSGTPIMLNNFTIKAGFVSQTTLGSAFISVATVDVFPATNYTPTTGIGNLDFPLATPIVWDGVSNLLVETCFNNNNGGGISANSISVQSSTVPTGLNLYLSQDNIPDVCNNSATPSSTTNRPNLRLEYQSPVSISWSPENDLYTDLSLTTPYITGDAVTVVFFSAVTGGNQTINAVATTNFGCTSMASISFDVLEGTSSNITEATCGTYTAPDGAVYNTSGIYTAVIPNAAGCDSTITIDLTIIPNTQINLNPVICEGNSYLSPAGNIYSETGTYNETVQPTQGCPVDFTINLTVNAATSSETVVTDCDSYEWNGTTYMQSGTYTITGLTNANGCDSTATLVLTINNSFEATETVIACDSFEWSNGTVYTESGTFIQELQTGAGCDSTLTLVLTINASSTNEVEVTACDEFVWNNMTYTESGEYVQVLQNASGCDSTVTLTLTINNSNSTTVQASACDSYTWSVNGETYNESGIYTVVLQNAAGCDSTIILDLTINNFTVIAINNGNATLTANTGVSFQWVTCPTFAPIAGETNQLFTAEQNGNYAVIATDANGCVDTSSCVSIVNVGIEDFEANNIAIYPNPTEDFVVIEFSTASATVEILDTQGKLIRTITVVSGDQVSLKNEQSAVYFVRIITENATTIHRIVKQ